MSKSGQLWPTVLISSDKISDADGFIVRKGRSRLTAPASSREVPERSTYGGNRSGTIFDGRGVHAWTELMKTERFALNHAIAASAKFIRQ